MNRYPVTLYLTPIESGQLLALLAREHKKLTEYLPKGLVPPTKEQFENFQRAQTVAYVHGVLGGPEL